MSDDDSFKLFVPSGYQHPLKISGRVGSRPDTKILGFGNISEVECARSSLPGFLDKLTFTFPIFPWHSNEYQPFVGNFYHCGEFFIASGRMMDVFRLCFGEDLEFQPIRMQHEDGTLSSAQYWAIFIKRIVECIDQNQSFTNPKRENDPPVPFSKNITQYQLDDALSKEFSNTGNGNYISYPHSFNVKNITLISGALEESQCIIQPKFWPGHWLISSPFAKILAATYEGKQGSHRNNEIEYCTWNLNLDSVRDHYMKLRQVLR